MSSVVVERAGLLESAHRVHVAVVDSEGRLTASVGDAERINFHRSAAKPFQAVPLVEDEVAERFALTTEELALCCASHNGEPEHEALARSILAKAGLDESELECGPHPPLDRAAADALLRAGGSPNSIHNNCSGKHAGMLALAVAHGWPTRGYVRRDHPVQIRMLAEMGRWTDLEEGEIGLGKDGCGVVSFATPLVRLAGAFARLGGADAPPHADRSGHVRAPVPGRGNWSIRDRSRPRSRGASLRKNGGRGCIRGGATDGSFGVAVKVDDGGGRVTPVVVLSVLDQMGVLDGIESESLSTFRRPNVTNTLGENVGIIRADFRLGRPA
jgi:L-asparaginase II